MQLGKTRVVELLDGEDVVYLVPIGDIHLGNEACDTERLAETIHWVKEHPRSLWIGMGDYAEFIGYRDSRFDPTVIDKAIPITKLGQLGAELNHQIGDRFQPIAGQCIGLVYGNHEDSYQLRTDAQNMHQDLCKALGVQNLGYSCFQRIEFQRGNRAHSYTIRAHHGSGWAQSDGGVINRLTKFMAQTDADLTLVGHLHKMDTAKKIELRFNGTAMVQRVKLGVLTGTYLRTYQDGITTYAEKRGYDPVPLGSYRIPLQPFGERTIGDVVV